MSQISFSSISLSPELQRSIAEMGYDQATLIQSQSIPLIQEGHDVIGLSQTGSGKTAAFGLPAIDMIDPASGDRSVQVLVLCPTRELAVQATDEIRKFAKYKHSIRVAAIYGGEPIGLQLTRLRQGCQIVVGTPGRVMDHMRRKTLSLANVKMVVLDEADEMLNMGFVEDIETILSETPDERQTILFSATMPAAVLAITKKYQKNPQMVEIKQQQRTVATIEQCYFDVPKGQKTAALFRLIEFYKPDSAIIFCNTKKMVDELILNLKKCGYQALGLHGDMRQSVRSQVMNQFKTGQIQILIATDVAARGIDVNDVKIVINYDLPMEDEYYVHRIGRTGRAGKAGQAFTLIQGGKQIAQLRNLMRYTKSEIVRKPLPTVAEIRNRQVSEFGLEVATFMKDNDFSPYASTVEQLMGDHYSAADVAAALVALAMKQKVSIDRIDAISAEFEETPYEEEPKNRSRRVPVKAGHGYANNAGSGKRQYDDSDMVSVRISIGRKDRIAPNHILGAVAGESGLSGKLFGAITIQNEYTTIDVPKELKKTVVQKLNKAKINGKTVTVY